MCPRVLECMARVYGNAVVNKFRVQIRTLCVKKKFQVQSRFTGNEEAWTMMIPVDSSKCSAADGWEGTKGPYVLGRIQFLLDFISASEFW